MRVDVPRGVSKVAHVPSWLTAAPAGTLEVVSDPHLRGGKEGVNPSRYVLHVDGKVSHRVILTPGKDNLGDFYTGMRISVSGHAHGPAVVHKAMIAHGDAMPSEHTATTSTMAVHSHTEEVIANRKLQQGPSPVKATGMIRALVVRVSMCGLAPSYSVDEIKGALFKDQGTKSTYLTGASNLDKNHTYTYEEAFESCSYNKGSIDPAGLIVLPQTISICQSNGQPYDLCTQNSLTPLSAQVDQALLGL